MKLIIVALAFVAVAVAKPAGEYVVSKPNVPDYVAAKQFETPVYLKPIEILRSLFESQPAGDYNFEFETANGIVRTETGEVKEVLDEENKPHKVVVVRGSYSYPGVDGKPELVNYYADEGGYHAEGDPIPKPVSPVVRQ